MIHTYTHTHTHTHIYILTYIHIKYIHTYIHTYIQQCRKYSPVGQLGVTKDEFKNTGNL